MSARAYLTPGCPRCDGAGVMPPAAPGRPVTVCLACLGNGLAPTAPVVVVDTDGRATTYGARS